MTIIRCLLSAAAVQKSKPADKDYDLPDGHGLTLSVRTSGKKSGVSVTSGLIPPPVPIYVRLLSSPLIGSCPHPSR